MRTDYRPETPISQEIDALLDPAILDFGANGCGRSQGARPPTAISAAEGGGSARGWPARAICR